MRLARNSIMAAKRSRRRAEQQHHRCYHLPFVERRNRGRLMGYIVSVSSPQLFPFFINSTNSSLPMTTAPSAAIRTSLPNHPAIASKPPSLPLQVQTLLVDTPVQPLSRLLAMSSAQLSSSTSKTGANVPQ